MKSAHQTKPRMFVYDSDGLREERPSAADKEVAMVTPCSPFDVMQIRRRLDAGCDVLLFIRRAQAEGIDPLCDERRSL